MFPRSQSTNNLQQPKSFEAWGGSAINTSGLFGCRPACPPHSRVPANLKTNNHGLSQSSIPSCTDTHRIRCGPKLVLHNLEWHDKSPKEAGIDSILLEIL